MISISIFGFARETYYDNYENWKHLAFTFCKKKFISDNYFEGREYFQDWIWLQFFIIIVYLKSSQCKHPIEA
jgi:hypothetical protein